MPAELARFKMQGCPIATCYHTCIYVFAACTMHARSSILAVREAALIFSSLCENALVIVSFPTGEGSGYSDCVYLVYDGIHYDPLAVIADNSNEPLQTLFPVGDDMRLAEALEIAATAKKV